MGCITQVDRFQNVGAKNVKKLMRQFVVYNNDYFCRHAHEVDSVSGKYPFSPLHDLNLYIVPSLPFAPTDADK